MQISLAGSASPGSASTASAHEHASTCWLRIDQYHASSVTRRAAWGRSPRSIANRSAAMMLARSRSMFRTAADLVAAAQLGSLRLGDVEEVLEVGVAHGLGLTALDQPLDAVLAEGLEHPEPRGVAAHGHQERLVGE